MSDTIKIFSDLPHVILLGAGASLAAWEHWEKIGPELPLMRNLVTVLNLERKLSSAGLTDFGDFELLYSKISDQKLATCVEKTIYKYFSSLKLPDKPTIYDYLVLSLQKKDAIATFNWDPFLSQAIYRNSTITKNLPKIYHLHGNVAIGYCKKDKVCGLNKNLCSKCHKKFTPSKLLYPIENKNYSKNKFIKNEWTSLRNTLNKAYIFSIYGYSAPNTDFDAKKLLENAWNGQEKNDCLIEQSESEFIDLKDKKTITESFENFIFTHHFEKRDNIFDSYSFLFPRRSCETFANAKLMNRPWDESQTRYPKDFKTLNELHNWMKPLLEEESQ